MKILAIETSCDETAAAIIGEGKQGPIIHSNVVSSQIDLHAEYGGVVPEVAARAHIESILPVIDKALKDGGATLDSLDYIAVTYGPGLVGSLIVGLETAKGISLSNNIPLIPVNHLEGHLYANFVQTNEKKGGHNNDEPEFPILALIISGGHTMLVLVHDHLEYQIVGRTRDDAAGEAFDKGAKIMGLGYPGGPIISLRAEKGDDTTYNFPLIDLTDKPYRDENGFLRHPEPSLDFSFSGLKTWLLTKVKSLTEGDKKLTEEEVNNLSASFQKAITENVTKNVLLAIEKYKPKTFIISGGVAANKNLREGLKDSIKNKYSNVKYLVPDFYLCTDNAAMIGLAAYYQLKKQGAQEKIKFDITPNPSLKLEANV